MKRSFIILLMFLPILSGCRKDNTPRTSGTDTIDNNLYGTGPYYAFGFSFSQAKKISILSDLKFDITIGNDGTLLNLILQTNNYLNSFYKVGEFADAASAEQAFKNLTSLTVPQWVVWADSIKANQVWLYRSGAEYYTKLRIISTISETRIVTTVSKDSIHRDYAECTFEWLYQPDGSLTFPGK
ncbi:MAG: hypothetical protein NT144_00345 [Bacteroidia bacterium]|nr:hypothetical protein [Bacteroidia bacterium]